MVHKIEKLSIYFQNVSTQQHISHTITHRTVYPQALKKVLRKKVEDMGSELKAFVHFKHEAGSNEGLDMEGFERAVERSGFNASQTAVRQLFNALDPNRCLRV